MIKEFKDFLMKGNIVDLAVAFVMGVAFAAVVNSLVNDLIMPIIAMIIGKPDFSDLTFTINDAVFRYGAFITSVITFVSVAAAVFLFVVKPMNAIKARTAKQEGEAISDEERRHQELLAALRERH
jgi:large conductance mechanosensitive channel